MTREELINTVAERYATKFTYSDGKLVPDTVIKERKIDFAQGANYAYGVFKKRAEKWIKEKWDDKYTHPLVIESVLEDFRKYMEG